MPWEPQTCKTCNSGARYIVQTEYGTLVCASCGTEDFTHTLSISSAYSPFSLPVHSDATYTRQKRFRKYLQRASMQQSAASIPKETWDYLCAGAPYRYPSSIVQRLKKAPKHIRKKCYDSLPFLVKNLCPHLCVPCLSEADKFRAMNKFAKLDEAYNRGEPFVSYLYALEYILRLIGRDDVVPFINKICCRKRRHAYRLRLDKILLSNNPRIPS